MSSPILKYFACRDPCYPLNKPTRYSYSHFADVRTETQRGCGGSGCTHRLEVYCRHTAGMLARGGEA